VEKIINFQGNCLYKTNINYSLSKEEKSYINNLVYKSTDKIHFISKNARILDNFLFNNLSKIFDQYAIYYTKNILEIDHKLKRLNSWITINKKNSFHPPHRHPNVFLSICFYPQIKNGKIIFQTYLDPLQKNTNLQFNILNKNLFNSNAYYFDISLNDLVIFPGWLNHFGNPNSSNIDRIMIGANYYISGNIGSDKLVNKLQLL